MSDPIRPSERKPGAAAGGRADGDPARVAELLAHIGALGAQIDAATQRSVDSLRRARGEPGIDAWDDAVAESLLELAARIEEQRRRLDAALEQDRARLLGSDEPAADAQATMDPGGPGMI